jgi:hypothetical protein
MENRTSTLIWQPEKEKKTFKPKTETNIDVGKIESHIP